MILACRSTSVASCFPMADFFLERIEIHTLADIAGCRFDPDLFSGRCHRTRRGLLRRESTRRLKLADSRRFIKHTPKNQYKTPSIKRIVVLMGFDQKHLSTPDPAQPLWKEYRDQFPVTEKLIYLNHAAVTPLPRPAAEAMQGLAQDALEYGSLHYDKWLDTYERVRVAAARLIGAERGEIAIVKNTSEGIATIAMGLAWHPGDRVVAFREEFPSN